MQAKIIGLAIASIMMASLTACANNANNINVPRKVTTGDLKAPLQNTDISNQKRDLPNSRINPLHTSMEIQQTNNGFVTIDQNSYSTGIPSSQFPHSKLVQNGQIWYYTFEPAGRQNSQTMNRSSSAIIPAPGPTIRQTSVKTAINRIAIQVIELTNNERRKNGLRPLIADKQLNQVAQTKTNEMNAKHYFSHTSPTYGSPFDMMRDFGITYRSAGENIAMGQSTAQQVVNAWMNSEGHRKNILSPNYSSIGVGFTYNGKYWSQMFIGK